ncbi:hypothetical protein I2486_00500 [Cellulophaga sp. E16_2]|uniref:hypothetical protein n=1 Tax=Cellulophaga sp. E16_2 TaxID=2789297 RepID=UPI001A91C5A0|nr:hypothetical protein [Cellulophaga sp. E16_2]MBO0589876.1 hypothetical protein [Cellulophaga sp. E16_2]
MNSISHQLHQKESGKLLILTLTKTSLVSQSGKREKLRTTQKDFDSHEDALKAFTKKEWEALKKGFRYTTQEAEIGEPSLHRYIGGGYTGALSFEATPKGIYTYKNNDEKDVLILIDPLGDTLEEIALPKQLAWSIAYSPERNALILDLDHFIYVYDIKNNTFRNLGSKKNSFTSFIAVAINSIAFATDDNISIQNNQDKLSYSQNYDTEVINGNIPFCGTLSKDGKLLALHTKVGEIQIIAATTGLTVHTIKADFEMIDQMEFSKDNTLLIAQEHYGTWGMRYFDLSNTKELKFPALEIPEYTKEVRNFCFSQDQSKLVLVQRTTAYVFDFKAKKFIHSFPLAHVVKSCEIKFIEDKLGVRTDYGCFSLYKV